MIPELNNEDVMYLWELERAYQVLKEIDGPRPISYTQVDDLARTMRWPDLSILVPEDSLRVSDGVSQCTTCPSQSEGPAQLPPIPKSYDGGEPSLVMSPQGLYAKACPVCNGDVELTTVKNETYLRCLQCGRTWG